jgi:hypothetical protein
MTTREENLREELKKLNEWIIENVFGFHLNPFYDEKLLVKQIWADTIHVPTQVLYAPMKFTSDPAP